MYDISPKLLNSFGDVLQAGKQSTQITDLIASSASAREHITVIKRLIDAYNGDMKQFLAITKLSEVLDTPYTY